MEALSFYPSSISPSASICLALWVSVTGSLPSISEFPRISITKWQVRQDTRQRLHRIQLFVPSPGRPFRYYRRVGTAPSRDNHYRCVSKKMRLIWWISFGGDIPGVRS